MMFDRMLRASILSMILLFFISIPVAVSAAEEISEGNEVTITGYIKDYRDSPVSSAIVKVYVNGGKQEIFDVIKGDRREEVETASDGSYNLRLKLADVEASKIELEMSKPSFRTQRIEVIINLSVTTSATE